jgi:hypothetical protein
MCPIPGCGVQMMRAMEQIGEEWLVIYLTEEQLESQTRELLSDHFQGKHSCADSEGI